MTVDELLEKVEGMGIPDAFTAECYSPGELMRRLGITDVSEFWLAVRSHRLPPAVWLPTSEPFCVWDRGLIEGWIACGMPVSPDVLAHNTIIISRLCEAVTNELTASKPDRN